MLCPDFSFFFYFAVLKSSHGSANFSVLGNRSAKNETNPSGERQVSKKAPLFFFFFYFWTLEKRPPSLTCDWNVLASSRRHRGGRVQKAETTRRCESPSAARAEPPPRPPAPDSLRTGEMEINASVDMQIN